MIRVAADVELHEQVERVASREDLIAFLVRLRADLGTGSDGWENGDLPSYLEALEAWTIDLPGYFRDRGEHMPEEPSWRLIAMLLLAATMYE